MKEFSIQKLLRLSGDFKEKHFFMSFFLIGLNLVPRAIPLEQSPEVEVGLASTAKMGGNRCKANECLMY